MSIPHMYVDTAIRFMKWEFGYHRLDHFMRCVMHGAWIAIGPVECATYSLERPWKIERPTGCISEYRVLIFWVV
jgi:hypothetical protein